MEIKSNFSDRLNAYMCLAKANDTCNFFPFIYICALAILLLDSAFILSLFSAIMKKGCKTRQFNNRFLF